MVSLSAKAAVSLPLLLESSAVAIHKLVLAKPTYPHTNSLYIIIIIKILLLIILKWDTFLQNFYY